MNEQAIPQRVDAVVIGSGALGASTAFHLASSGLSVALLDKADLASQTSPRAAGLSGQLRSNPTMTCIAAKAVQKITTFQADSGEPMGRAPWRRAWVRWSDPCVALPLQTL
jgi:glycine/D-amino acid oxidase-like deaminating enzyme